MGLRNNREAIKSSISFNSLTEEDKQLLSKVPKLNKTYVCCHNEIPLITFYYSSGSIYYTIEC